MNKIATLALTALLTTLAASAVVTRTTRGKLTRLTPPAGVELVTDTLKVVTPDSVTVSGYDKRLRSRRESFFITNHSAGTLLAVTLLIEYTDTEGRPLHNTTRRLNCNLAPGETRNFNIPTWDRQSSFYYRLSDPPKRSGGIPYDVNFTLTDAIVAR